MAGYYKKVPRVSRYKPESYYTRWNMNPNDRELFIKALEEVNKEIK